MNTAKITEAVDYIQQHMPFAPQIGVVLGSGLGGIADAVPLARALSYQDIPHFPQPTIVGHAGRLVFARVGTAAVAILQGRAHLYEGHNVDDVVRPVRVLAQLGMRLLLVTNAAGGVNAAFTAGDLMLITDQLNLQGVNPLTGPNDERFGPRFPDMTNMYDPCVRAIALASAQRAGVSLQQGVYAGVPGPTYETPAEIRMFRTLGADAVGMSTVQETMAARHLGVRVGGISVITNQAAGVALQPLSHADVVACAQQANARLTAVLTDCLHHCSSLLH
ncbi:MAG: purine-nucleoside phosphorylase [bacterium]|nr:purine-nucleoside phosphorylase [bacterium]